MTLGSGEERHSRGRRSPRILAQPRRADFPKKRKARPRKIFLFRFSEMYALVPPSRLGKRGVTRRHERGVRDAMDAAGSSRRMMLAVDGKSAWS